jgi:hypothetical protein
VKVPEGNGMKFGIFMAPFHKVGENPALAFERGRQQAINLLANSA